MYLNKETSKSLKVELKGKIGAGIVVQQVKPLSTLASRIGVMAPVQLLCF